MEPVEQLLYIVLEMKDDISEIKEDTVKNTSNLEYHIKRTDLLEETVTVLKIEVLKIAQFHSNVNFVLKILGGILGSSLFMAILHKLL